MTELTLWRKQEIDKFRREMDLLFRRFRREFGVSRSLLERAEPFSVKLSETENTLILRAQLQGIKPEALDISVTDEAIILKGRIFKTTIEKDVNFERIEESSHTISKNISLPCRILPDDVRATYKDGILEIVLPKCRPVKPRGVKIESK
jgi:HSP20 family protein